MEGISLNIEEILGRRDVVSQSTNGSRVASHVILLPLSEERHEEVTLELSVEHLTEEVEVGDESCLQNDWDVRSVEKFDRVLSLVATDTSRRQLKFNSESLHKWVSDHILRFLGLLVCGQSSKEVSLVARCELTLAIVPANKNGKFSSLHTQLKYRNLPGSR